MGKKHDKDDPDIAAAQGRIQRERAVREATASVELEGFTFSAEQDADFASYVRGEITSRTRVWIAGGDSDGLSGR